MKHLLLALTTWALVAQQASRNGVQGIYPSASAFFSSEPCKIHHIWHVGPRRFHF